MPLWKLGLSTAALPVLLFLPGFLLLQYLRDQKLSLPLAEWIFQSVLASTLLTSALAFPLAELGLFSLPLLLGLLLGLSVLLIALIWKQQIPLRLPRPRWEDLFPLLLALLCGVVTFHPHEYVLGSGDPGSYLNIGVAIADTGAIISYSQDLAALDPQMAKQELLFREIPVPLIEEGYHHIPGFMIADLETGKIVPQFYHLFPTWIAIGYTLFDLSGCLYVVPLFGVLAILAIYFAGKAIFGQWSGLLSSLLLSVNMVQVWFSRYSTSEIISQYFLFSAVYMFVLYLNHPDPSNDGGKWLAGQGILTGGALAALLHLRVDSLLALLPIVLWGLYLLIFRRQLWRAYRPLFLTLILTGAHFILYVFLIPRRYMSISLFGLYYYLLRPAIAISLIVLSMGGFLVVSLLVWRGWLKRHERAVRWVIITLLAVLAIFAYFIWPAITPPQSVQYYTWPELVSFTFENDENLVRLGWYLTPWGILLGMLGLLEAIRREAPERIAYLLFLFFLYGVLYIYHGGDAPVHIHTMRRYVPVVIPTLALGMAYALQRLGQLVRGKAGPLLAALLGLILIVLTALPTWPLIGHVDYAGAVEQVTSLAQRFDENALLLFTDVETGVLLGMPLHYVFHHPTFILQQVQPDPAGLSAQVQAWEDQGKTVYLIAAAGRSHLSTGDFAFSLQETLSFTLTRLEHTTDRRPEQTTPIVFSLEIYHLHAGRGIRESDRFIDVGTADYPFLAGGFWGKEVLPDGTTFRWTNGDAEIVLPGEWFSSTGPLSLTLSLGHSRFPGITPPQLEVLLEGDLLTRFIPQPGFHPYTMPLSAEVAAGLALQKEVHLQLYCDVWQPSTAGSADERELGVFVDWVQLK